MAITAEQLLVVGMVGAAFAAMPRGAQPLRGAMAVLGVAAVVWGAGRHHAAPVAAGAALAVVNIVALMLSYFSNRRAGFSAEEKVMAARLAGLRVPAIRRLLDLGIWIDGRAGEVLIREGEPVSHLFFLAAGEAAIVYSGHEIATCGPGHFLGEITVLDGDAATAGVRLRTDARFWCVTGEALRGFLAVNPAFGAAIDAAFAGDLRDKLRLASRRIAELTVR